jgi:hypothetical protein
MKQDFWIARNKNDDLYLYSIEPRLYSNGKFGIATHLYYDIVTPMRLDNCLFPDITFEKSPQRVYIKRVKFQ